MAPLRPPRPSYRFSGTKQEPDISRRSAATQSAILAAAARLVRRRGYNAVTVEAIAAEAGAGKQTIYRWWKTKAALYAELLGEVEPPSGPSRGSALAELRRMVARMARRYASPLTARIQAGLLAEADNVTGRLLSADGGRLRAILGRAMTRGEIRRNADIGLAAEQLIAGLWYRAVVGGRRPDRRFSLRLIAQTLRGLAP